MPESSMPVPTRENRKANRSTPVFWCQKLGKRQVDTFDDMIRVASIQLIANRPPRIGMTRQSQNTQITSLPVMRDAVIVVYDKMNGLSNQR